MTPITMTPITMTLLWCALQVTLFALVASVGYLLVRRINSATSTATLVGSLALVLGITLLAASPWPRWQFEANESLQAKAAPKVVVASEDARESDLPLSQSGENLTLDAPAESPLAAAWQAFSSALADPQPATSNENTSAKKPSTIGNTWNLLWMAGIVCLLVSTARLVWGLVQVRKLLGGSRPIENDALTAKFLQLQKQLGLKKKVSLRESPDLPTPATVGWRSPSILLPKNWPDWSAAEAEAVLAHELSHVASRDYLAWIVARLAVAIHFYHPLVHWLAGRLQLEQELAADAMAVRLVGDRKQYLHSLASLALATPAHRVAGPLRTMIPSRSLLMRRVEMLRTSKNVSTPPKFARFFRFLSLGLLAMLALAVAGVRQSATGQDAPTPPKSGGAPETTGTFQAVELPDRIPLSVLPVDTIYVTSIRPADLLAGPEFDSIPLAYDIAGTFSPSQKKTGLSIRDIAEVMSISYGDPKDLKDRAVVRFLTATACDKFTLGYGDPAEVKMMEGKLRKVWTKIPDMQTIQLDPLTLIIDNGRLGNEAHMPVKEWQAQWEAAKDRSVVAAIDIRSVRLLIAAKRGELLGGFPMQMFAPMYDHVNWTVASADLTEKGLKFDILAECDSEENAQVVANTTQAAMTLAGNALKQQPLALLPVPPSLPHPHPAATQLAILQGKVLEMAGDFLANPKPRTDGRRVSLAFESDLVRLDDIATFLRSLPPPNEARTAARRSRSKNNLKQLALTMHNYHGTYGHFPPAVIQKEGQPPHSWRVAILPFFEQQQLYDQYKFEEPWDSDANKKVLAQMPALFRSPTEPDAESTDSSYFALTGPDTVFSDEKGARFKNITDGLSNTLLLVEAKRSIPWTKPEDIPYTADGPLPKLGGWFPDVFLVAMCDGSVHTIATKDLDEKRLRAWITKAGGERVPGPGAE